MQLLHENEAGRLESWGTGYLCLIWLPGSSRQQAAQQLLEELLFHLQQTRYGKLLSDQRHLAAYSDRLVSWLLTSWLPRTLVPGYLRQMAILPCPRLEIRLRTMYLFAEARERYGLCSHVFAHFEEASQWLQESE